MLELSLELVEQICHFCDPTTAVRLCSTCNCLYKTCVGRAPEWRLAHFQEASQKATFHPPVLEEGVYDLDYDSLDESDGDSRYNHSYLVIALQPEAMVEVVNKLPQAAGAQIAAGLKLTENAIHAMIDVLLKHIRVAIFSSPEEMRSLGHVHLFIVCQLPLKLEPQQLPHSWDTHMLKLMSWIRSSLATHKACLSGSDLQDPDISDQSDMRYQHMLMLEVTQVVRDIGETDFLPYGLSASTPELFSQETFPQTTFPHNSRAIYTV